MVEVEFLMPIAERIAQFRSDYSRKSAYARQLAIFERGCAALDLERAEALRIKWLPILSQPEKVRYTKYFDTVYWLWHKSAHIEWLDLDRLPPQSVLDIGSGPGHFLFLCQALGHRAVGLDPDYEVYREICEMQQVDTRVGLVKVETPLSDFGRSFDLVTAIWIKFDESYVGNDRPRRARYWSGAEWLFFFEDLKLRLNPGARIFLELNTHYQPDGTLAHDQVFIQSCLENGARKLAKKDYRLLFENADQLAFKVNPAHGPSFGFKHPPKDGGPDPFSRVRNLG